jgi:hypothetical protein
MLHRFRLFLFLPLLAGAPAYAQEAPAGSAEAASPTLQLALPAETGQSNGPLSRATDSIIVSSQEDDLPWYHSGYPWQASPSDVPDEPGLQRDTLYFLGYQLVAIGVLYMLPESVTNWDKDSWKDEDVFGNWWENITHPEWDKDDWGINYVAHPYWGAAHYIRGRERGLDRTHSFLYSVLLSTLYETTYEAFFEPVSYQDLIVTPIIGSLVGEYLFSPLREHIRAKPGGLSWSDKTLLFATDPLGVLGAWTDRMLGVESRLTLQPVGSTRRQNALPESEAEAMQRRALAASTDRPWGVQVEIPW